ncbi:hypothetical protein VTJ49DRAFT_7422 [Mycothermus thermophilus]|uniref:Uncharacterized protein n=1 Tax=Humicola insolens TaxID=85995 RepID=A0ABR3VI12_HUMIN
MCEKWVEEYHGCGHVLHQASQMPSHTEQDDLVIVGEPVTIDETQKKDTKESKETKESKDTKNTKDPKDPKDPKESK